MFQRLQAFISVYQTRSFTQTADDLFISQPSVSAHIKNLEQDLGVTLFERGKRQAVQPTVDADLFYPQAQKLLRDWQQTRDFFNLTGNQSVVKVGASHFSALTLIPDIVTSLTDASANLDIKMANTHTLLKQVAQGELDFALVEQTVYEPTLSVVQIMQDKLVLAGNSEPWLLREEGASAYEQTKRYFAQYGLPEKIMTIQNTDIILALLKKGMGRTIISKQLLSDEIPFETLDDTFQRPVNLVWREPLTDMNREILRIIQQTVGVNMSSDASRS